MKRTVYCYAECRNGEWEAICVDLDIAVQGGESLSQVLEDLKVAILEHMNYVMTLPEGERESLLYRPVPLSLRLKLILAALKSLLRRGGNDRGQGSFTLPCAA